MLCLGVCSQAAPFEPPGPASEVRLLSSPSAQTQKNGLLSQSIYAPG